MSDTAWDERRGWAYLVWRTHLERRPEDHRRSGHPCDACRMADLLNLGPWDSDRLIDEATPPAEPARDTNVIPFRGRGA